jgi:hypothetical protein
MATIMDAVQVGQARAWIEDAFEDVNAWALQPLEVARFLRRHYAGGIEQFLADGCTDSNA